MPKKLMISLCTCLGLCFLPLTSYGEPNAQAEAGIHNFNSRPSPVASQTSQANQSTDQNNGNARNPFLCGACHRDREVEIRAGSL